MLLWSLCRTTKSNGGIAGFMKLCRQPKQVLICPDINIRTKGAMWNGEDCTGGVQSGGGPLGGIAGWLYSGVVNGGGVKTEGEVPFELVCAHEDSSVPWLERGLLPEYLPCDWVGRGLVPKDPSCDWVVKLVLGDGAFDWVE